jgi:hypothetical protein
VVVDATFRVGDDMGVGQFGRPDDPSFRFLVQHSSRYQGLTLVDNWRWAPGNAILRLADHTTNRRRFGQHCGVRGDLSVDRLACHMSAMGVFGQLDAVAQVPVGVIQAQRKI